MKLPAARFWPLALLIASAPPPGGLAQDKPAGEPTPRPAASTPSDLAFLEIGRTYFIRFPEGHHPMILKESGIAPQPNGPPGTWRITYTIDLYTVRKLGGGSWALLEHPVDPKATTEILAARDLVANKALVAEIEADPERKEFLAGRREAARGELKMTQTWINLAHAITISDPPTADAKRELKFNVEIK